MGQLSKNSWLYKQTPNYALLIVLGLSFLFGVYGGLILAKQDVMEAQAYHQVQR